MENPVKIKSILQTQKLFRHNLDLIIVCASLLAVGTFLNGVTALIQAALCVGTCILCELVSSKFVLKKFTFDDLSAVSTALIIALMLPANAPLYIGVIASAVAILVAKLPFGSAQNTPFVPACVGFCAVSVLYPQYVFEYLEKSATFSFFPNAAETLSSGKTLLEYLMMGNSISFNLFTVLDLLSGSFAGAIGTTSILALLGAFLYLFIQNPRRLLPAFGYIGMCAAFAVAFPRVSSGIFTSIIMELCAGSLIFTALILISDPITAPKNPIKAVCYGAFAGAIYMLLRYYGKVEDPACFSVLIANAIGLVFKNKSENSHHDVFDVVEIEEVKELLEIMQADETVEDVEQAVIAELQEIQETIEEGDEDLEIEKRDAQIYIDSIIHQAQSNIIDEPIEEIYESLQKLNDEIEILQEEILTPNSDDEVIEIELDNLENEQVEEISENLNEENREEDGVKL